MRTTEHTPPRKPGSGKSKIVKPRAGKRKMTKMQAYRARMRARGMKQIQIWVPDTSKPGFAEEARRQSLLLRGTKGEKEALEFIEAIFDSDYKDWQ